NNDYTGTNGGRYPAGSGYDMSTGLGTPSAAALAGSLCPAAFRVNPPARQVTSVGQKVSLQIATSDRRGGIVYGASGLPPGLSVNSATGRISGKPKKAGVYRVGVMAINRDGGLRGTKFVWQVAGRPTVTAGGLSGLGSSRPRLQLTVNTAGGAPALKSVAVDAAPGLRFVAGRGKVTVRAGNGRPVRFRLVIRAGRMQILLT